MFGEALFQLGRQPKAYLAVKFLAAKLGSIHSTSNWSNDKFNEDPAAGGCCWDNPLYCPGCSRSPYFSHHAPSPAAKQGLLNPKWPTTTTLVRSIIV
jgi:hypothetical protein